MRLLVLFFFCQYLGSNPLQSATCDDYSAFDTPSIQEAKWLHDQALHASRKEVEDSEKRLFELLEKEPHNQLLRAYTGSLLTIKSGKSLPGPAALRIFNEGVRMMNQAVENAPTDVNVRLIRAINHLELPAFFNKKKQSRDDFNWLLSEIKSAKNELVPDITASVIYYYAGLSEYHYGDKKNASNIWREGLKKIKNHEWRVRIARALGESTVAR